MAAPPVPRRKLAILQPSYKDTTSIIKDLDVARKLDPWIPKEFTEVEYIFITRAHHVQQIRDAKADAYLNLCDGAWDEDAPGIEVVTALERFKKAFTGAPSRFYDPTKESMKKVCHYWNIPTPSYYFAYTPEDMDHAIAHMRFPMFVKHFHGYNSVGITTKSKVTNAQELREEASKMVSLYGGALIEEFVDGREFSCLVVSNPANEQEPVTFVPVECKFPVGVNYKTFEYKWKGEAKNPWVMVEDKELSQRIQDITRNMYLAMDGEGYARTDIRMDQKGDIYVLEINPNPSIFYADDDGATADVILTFDGYGKAKFLKLLLEFAEHRRRREEKLFVVQLKPDNRLRTYAVKDIAQGALIFSHEEQPHRLVSRSHVEKNWTPQFKRFFADYCWPLSENVYGMWDREPDSWKPLSHSCDPNCWFEGLNMVARRAIKRGEEITMDYATEYASSETPYPQFKCDCGARKCRGGFVPSDCLQDWFEQAYGEHVSDFVRMRQKQVRGAKSHSHEHQHHTKEKN